MRYWLRRYPARRAGEAGSTTIPMWRFLVAQVVYLLRYLGPSSSGIDRYFRSRDRAAVHRHRSTCCGPVLKERTLAKQWFDMVVGLASFVLVLSGNIHADGRAPCWTFLLCFTAMVSLVGATLVERRAAPGAAHVDVLKAVRGGVGKAICFDVVLLTRPDHRPEYRSFPTLHTACRLIMHEYQMPRR